MASLCKIVRWSLNKRNPNYVRLFHRAKVRKSNNPAPLLYVVGGTIVLYTAYKCRKFLGVHALQSKEERLREVKLGLREKRFIRFASVEYDGQVYMTPQDFLESVVEEEPRPRFKRKVLTAEELETMLNSTPPLKEGSTRFFRNLRDKGIISYTEYLFLLSILIKPESGFRIAFDMFDLDGNKRVDKSEVLVMEKIFSYTWKGKRGMVNKEGEKSDLPIQEQYVDDEQGLQRKHVVDTTLMIHFFGPEGKRDINFKNFKKFMLHLQTEVLQSEFSKFAKGLPTISEVDFANMLLRYTYMPTEEYELYLDHLDRIKQSKGITFDEFYVFSQFLNNLEDFAIAMQMYTLADYPISKDEFHRAVHICTGKKLSPHVINTVFALFDDDGDDMLSYLEFIAVMKDRLHRGPKPNAKDDGWETFRTCVTQEMMK